jgi:hypothetical protein
MREDEMQNSENNVSPSDKLEDNQQPGSRVPGAENPESKEVKKEINPNTE